MIASGEYETTAQDESQVSKAPKIYHDMCAIDFKQPTGSVYNFIRGLSPFPTAWTTIDGQQVNIYRCRPVYTSSQAPPGALKTDQKKVLEITTTDGAICIHELQMEGRKRMKISGMRFSF